MLRVIGYAVDEDKVAGVVTNRRCANGHMFCGSCAVVCIGAVGGECALHEVVSRL